MTLKEAFDAIKKFLKVNDVKYGEIRIVIKKYKIWKFNVTKEQIVE